VCVCVCERERERKGERERDRIGTHSLLSNYVCCIHALFSGIKWQLLISFVHIANKKDLNFISFKVKAYKMTQIQIRKFTML
jgi:hypothetical protein